MSPLRTCGSNRIPRALRLLNGSTSGWGDASHEVVDQCVANDTVEPTTCGGHSSCKICDVFQSAMSGASMVASSATVNGAADPFSA